MSDPDKRAPNGWPLATDLTGDWKVIEAEANSLLADGLPKMGTPYWSPHIASIGFGAVSFSNLEPWTRFERGSLFQIAWRHPMFGFEFDERGCDPNTHGFEGVVGGILKISEVKIEMLWGGGQRSVPVGPQKIYKVVQYDDFAGVYVLRYAD